MYPISSCIFSLILVKTSLQTLLKRKATGEKGPATELEPGTYTLSRSFSHTSHQSQPQILRLPAANPSSPIALCTGRECNNSSSFEIVSHRKVVELQYALHKETCGRLQRGLYRGCSKVRNNHLLYQNKQMTTH